jgi:hypothetical protein
MFDFGKALAGEEADDAAEALHKRDGGGSSPLLVEFIDSSTRVP